MKRMVILLLVTLLVTLSVGLAWLLWGPARIEPKAWTPPQAPQLAGPYAPNERLRGIEKLALDAGEGPEGVTVDPQGYVLAGYADGRIVRLDPASNRIEVLGNTGGRPLGLAMATDGSILVADAERGLMELRPGAAPRVLSSAAEGQPFRLVDDVDVSADSPLVYFTDASARFGLHDTPADFMEHGGTGRLLSYDRETRETKVLLEGLHFPNGVALGPDEEYLLVNETQTYSVLRYWLRGDKAGQAEVLIDNLPGLPDNLSFNGTDRIWIALYSPRIAVLDEMLPKPWLRRILARFPESVNPETENPQPKPVMKSFVLALDLNGRVIESLQYESADAYAPITSVEQHGDTLYFGSLAYPAIGRMRLNGDPEQNRAAPKGPTSR